MIVKGYRGNVCAKKSQELASRGIYVFNYLCVGCREHIEWAYNKMLENFSKGKNIANKEHLEMMLILSGRRQIKDAIALCSSEASENIVAISTDEFELAFPRNDKMIEFDEKKLKHLKITQWRNKNCEMFFENSAMLELER